MKVLDLKSIAICFFLLSLMACAKKYNTTNFPSTQLHFGNGGGFAGKVTDFLLLENGQVFYKEPFGKDYLEIGKIKPKQAKVFYKQVTDLQNVSLNKPHNNYQYINLQKQDTTYRYVFSGGGLKQDSITSALLMLYENMITSMPKKEKNGVEN